MEEPLEHEPPFQWHWPDLLVFVVFSVATALLLPPIAFVFFRFFDPGLQIKDLTGTQWILIQALMDSAWVGFIFFLINHLHGRSISQTLRWIRGPNLAIGRMIAAGILLAVTATLVSAFLPAPQDTPLDKLLRMTPTAVVLAFGILFVPVAEEIIFRGFLFAALADLFGSKTAVPLTAALFASLHISQRGGNPGAIAIIFAVGYVFTIVRRRTGSVISSVLIHAAYNSTLFLLPTIFGQKSPH